MLPVVTHSQTFHADEVMAVAILRILGLCELEVIRTRDRSHIKEMIGEAFIVDVGGVYDPDRLQFDHHQASFDEYFDEDSKKLGIKMSSCGLVYLHLGRELFGSRKASVVDEWHRDFYKAYIQEIDANDNGVSELKELYDNRVFRYSRGWTLPSIVSSWNSTWAKLEGHVPVQDLQFSKAVQLCQSLLRMALDNFIAEKEAHQRALEIVNDHETTEYWYRDVMFVVLHQHCKYSQVLEDREKQRSNKGKWVFTVLPAEAGKNDPNIHQWHVHTVGVPGKKFHHRMNILAFEDAKALLGDDLEFVHNNRFIAVTKNRESAIKLAKASVIQGWEKREKKAMAKWGKMIGSLIVLLGIILGMFRVFQQINAKH